MQNIVAELNSKCNNKDADTILRYIMERFSNKIALASSLSIEDQVLTDMILKINRKAIIFTIDTGMLPYETYSLIDKTRSFYNYKLKIYFPEHETIESMVNENGMHLFYDSIQKRKYCCFNRKIIPLRRALKGLEAWICGLRKEQSVTRKNLDIVEIDEVNSVLKFNPILNWTEDEVWEYIKKNNVPYNELYKKGYLSIGCAPCTRAVKANEDVRAGRWWWENPETKECGLHLKPEE